MQLSEPVAMTTAPSRPVGQWNSEPPGRLRLDKVLAFLVPVLALYLAFFPVQNSDFWLHIGTGKAYLSGQATLDAEPFRGTETNQWINHSWLFDGILYVLYPDVLGGAGVVMLKALLVAALAGLLLYAGRVGRNLFLPAVSVALTIVALGPWLEFRPTVISLLFFAVTLAVLEKSGVAHGAYHFRWWRVIGLSMMLTALWVNMDAWFILFPLALVLCICGALLDRLGGTFAGSYTQEAPSLGWLAPGAVLLAVLAACLLNPYHIFIFPSAATACLTLQPVQEQAFAFGHIIMPPGDTLSPAAAAMAPARAAYWTLALLGGCSFVMNWKNWRWSRALLWLFFLGASIYQPRITPFFAVVGGVALALNSGELLETYLATTNLARWLPASAVGVGRLVLTLAISAVLVICCVGLLGVGLLGTRQAYADVDPSLRLAAERLGRWRDQGRITAGRGFLFSVELANLFAWLDPDAQALVNSHGPANPAAAADHMALRQALLGSQEGHEQGWRDILRRRGIDHIVLYANDQRLVETAVARLLPNSREWVLLFWKGRTVIFGWQDPEQPGRAFADMRLTPIRRAFSEDDATTAPRVSKGQTWQPLASWPRPWQSFEYRSTDLDEAGLALTFFDLLSPKYAAEVTGTWNRFLSSGYVGLGGTGVTPALNALVRLGAASASGNPLAHLFIDERDLGPRSALYLALRAARRTLRDNPENPFAYLLLGEAYLRLGRSTQEKAWAKNEPSFGRLRTVQMMTAYKQAVRLKPDLPLAHYRLFELFRVLDFKDLALQHLQEYLRLAETREPAPGEAGEVALLKKTAVRRATQIGRLEEEYELASGNFKVLDRARLAGDMGLVGRALNTLLNEDVSAFGTPGMDLELKLLLVTGESEKVRLWMDEEMEPVLPAYHWNKAQVEAALGDYEAADADLRSMVIQSRMGTEKMPVRNAAALMLAQGLLDYQENLYFKSLDALAAGSGAMPQGLGGIFFGRAGLRAGLLMAAKAQEQETEITVLRGILAVEAGRIAEADALFRRALVFWNSPTGRYLAGFSSSHSRTIAAMSRQALETARQRSLGNTRTGTGLADQ